ncbi:light-harvesting chlorophyll-a/b protein of photosystem I [Haematococcus lacustris]
MATSLASRSVRNAAISRGPACSPRRSVAARAANRPMWLPGNAPPAHLDGSLPGDFGFDPLGLGSSPESLKWFAESERVHARWAMLATAGVLAQELAQPDVFWYTTGAQLKSPIPILGLLAVEFWAMHFVEIKRWQDFRKPGSADRDPLFPGNSLAPHEVGYPGGIFAPFVPGNLEELKVKEIKNGRLAMLAFIGFVMSAQVTGLNPIAALKTHIADPFGTTIFSKAAVIPGQAVSPPCAIPPSVQYEGITIPTPCFLQTLWP